MRSSQSLACPSQMGRGFRASELICEPICRWRLPRRRIQTATHKIMRNVKTLAAIVAGGLAVCGLAIAQVHDGAAAGHDSQHHGDPAAMAAHLAQFFPKIAAFDADKNGKLDDKEKESLAKAIADGTVELPAHNSPDGNKPNVEMVLNHIVEV